MTRPGIEPTTSRFRGGRNIYTCRHETLNEAANFFVEKLSLNCSKWPWSRVMDTRALEIDHLIVFQHGQLYSDSVYEDISRAKEDLLHAKRMVIVSVCSDESITDHSEACKTERVYCKDKIFLFEFHVLPLTWEAHRCTANNLTKLHTVWLRLKTPGAKRKFHINPERVRCICAEEGLNDVRAALFKSLGQNLKCGSWHNVIVGKYGNDTYRLILRFGTMPSAEQRKVIEKRLPEAQYTILISACVKGDLHRIPAYMDSIKNTSTDPISQRPIVKEKTSISASEESYVPELKTLNDRSKKTLGIETSQASTRGSNQDVVATVRNPLTRPHRTSDGKEEHIETCKHPSIRVDHEWFTYFEIHVLRGFQNDIIIPLCKTNIATIQALHGIFGVTLVQRNFFMRADNVRSVCYNDSLKGTLSLLCRELHVQEKRRTWLTTVGRRGRDWNLLILLPGQIPRSDEMSRLEKRVANARLTVFIFVCEKSGNLIRKDLERSTDILSLEQQLNSAFKDHEDICDESLIIYEKEQFIYFELHVIDGIDTLPDCNTNHRVLAKLKEIFISPIQSVQNVHEENKTNSLENKYVDSVVNPSETNIVV
ncbi:hypothetical protein ACJMK2_020340 [Sinanodonta woodiana]|uniref:Uncharacterized protein n=1 Tax=Sinanodonta woodiana TaxID=1069815 RepID=A0ABD3TZU0_SINWO